MNCTMLCGVAPSTSTMLAASRACSPTIMRRETLPRHALHGLLRRPQAERRPTRPRHAALPGFYVVASSLQNVPPAAASSFQVFRVVGDGSCLFRSIVQGAQIAKRGVPMAVGSEGQAAAALRQAVVAELIKRREDIEPFIPGILDGDLSFETYCERMSHMSAWGGEPEMVMAVNVVRMPISVWRITRSGAELIVTYGEELKNVPAINLLWHQAGHYDLLVLSGAAESGADAAI